MKRYTAFLMMLAISAAAAGISAQRPGADDQRALRQRIEERFDVVQLTGGVGLRPKSRTGDVRLIEITDTIAVNGVPVTGVELRQRVGADADAILRLSYLDPAVRRELFAAAPLEAPDRPEPPERPERAEPIEPERSQPIEPERTGTGTERRRDRSSHGDRVRVFGNVRVDEGEQVGGSAVAVMGSVRIDGEVQDVVAVMGSVDLGPRAVVRGDVVTVGGRLNRSSTAHVGGAVTEVALGGPGTHVSIAPWFGGFDGFGPITRLMGSAFRFGLLALLACVALVVARRPVEGSAIRVADNPFKAALVGFAAWVLFAPLLLATAIVLAISIVGIPLLLLLPFAVLALLLMALVGFSGTAYAVGQWARRRMGMGTVPPAVDVCLGILVIMLPLLLGRVVALAGWPLSPIVFLLVAIGLALEFVAWSSGLGAVLTNAFGRWQANRAMRTPATVPTPTTPPPTPL
jgi:hypothetical protein